MRVAHLRVADDDTIALVDQRKQREAAAFTAIPRPSLQASLDWKSGNAEQQMDAALLVLRQRLNPLRATYRHYAALDPGPQLTAHGFLAFGKDTGLDRVLRGRQLERVFLHCVGPRSGSGHTAPLSPRTNDPTEVVDLAAAPPMRPPEFAHALTRIAHLRYGGHLAAALNTLLDECLPLARQCDADQLKAIIRRVAVQEVLRKNAKFLHKVFAFYSPKGGQMTLADFARLLSDCKVVGPSFPAAEVLVAFAVAQDEYLGNASRDAPPALSFNEFIDAVVCVAIQKNPAPYLPPALALSRFLERTVSPALFKAHPAAFRS